MDNPCKPLIEEKLYTCPRIVEANIKSDTPPAKSEVRQVECGKGFKWFGKGKVPPESVIPPEEMSPPPYSDLGKKAKDVFNKGYHFGLVKLDIKTKSTSGVEFNTSGSSNQESGKVSGSLETKYKVKDYGLTFTEKWTTDNTLSTEIAVQDQLVPGLKVSTALNFAPQTGQKTGNVKTAFVNKYVALNADGNYTADGPKVSASAVVGYQGWLAGYLADFDINNTKLTKSNFALGFQTADFTLHSNVDPIEEDGIRLGGSIYQKINPKLEYGIMIDWLVSSSDGGGEGGEGGDDKKNEGGEEKKKEGEEGGGEGGKNTFAVAAQYQLDADCAVRFKVDNNVQVGIGLSQRLREGVTIFLSANIDGKNLDQGGGHKVGFALELEADDGQEFGGSIHQKLNPQLETGISLNWSSGSSNTKFGIGAKYDLDRDASLRFKVNNQSQIGLGYQQRLRDGVTLTLSSLIDGKNFNQGGHKIGLALELEA